MKITIMRDQLVAALCTTAKADIRYYLNGVYVEATNAETRLTSTDGHVMSTQRADAVGDNEVDGVIRIIIPTSALEGIKKHKTIHTVEVNDDGGSWGIVDYPARIGFTPVEGQFPDYRRIIPARLSGEPGQFDPRLIAQFTKAATALGATHEKIPRVLINHNGKDCALVSLGRDTEYVGVIAPLKPLPQFLPSDAPPSWATTQLETVEDLV